MKTKDSLSYSALIISIIISITSLSIVAPRSKTLDFDYIGVIIGLLSLIVTVLIGWQIYSTINIKNLISKEVDDKLKGLKRVITSNRQLSICYHYERIQNKQGTR